MLLTDGTVYPYKGRITYLDPVVNADTGTFNMRVEVKNPNGALRPGQFVRVRIQGVVRPNAIMVPQQAIMQGPSGKFVYVVDADNTAQPRPVQVGDWYGDQWLIDSGLKGGDRVVVNGAARLQPGAPVQIQPAAAPDAQPAKP